MPLNLFQQVDVLSQKWVPNLNTIFQLRMNIHLVQKDKHTGWINLERSPNYTKHLWVGLILLAMPEQNNFENNRWLILWENYWTLAGIILELSDVYGNKTTMIMPMHGNGQLHWIISKILANDIIFLIIH